MQLRDWLTVVASVTLVAALAFGIAYFYQQSKQLREDAAAKPPTKRTVVHTSYEVFLLGLEQKALRENDTRFLWVIHSDMKQLGVEKGTRATIKVWFQECGACGYRSFGKGFGECPKCGFDESCSYGKVILQPWQYAPVSPRDDKVLEFPTFDYRKPPPEVVDCSKFAKEVRK